MLQPVRASLARLLETEGLLPIAILRLSHPEHLPLYIGAQSTSDDHAIFIKVCCAVQSFEQLIGKQPMSTWFVIIGLLNCSVADNPHDLFFPSSLLPP